MPVYLVDTNEYFFKSAFYHTLVKCFFASGNANLSTFRGEPANHEKIKGEVSTVSLFAEKEIVRVTEAYDFLKANITWFEHFLANADTEKDVATVILLEGDATKHKKSLKAINTIKKLDKKYDFIVKIPEIKDYNKAPWLIKHAKEKHGIGIRKAEAELIIENTGYELSRIDIEIEKIAMFIHPNKTVTRADINELTLFDRENTIYEMTDAVSERNINKALVYLDQLLITGTSPVWIILMIYRAIKKMLQGKLMLEQGASKETISRALRINMYFFGKFLRQVRYFSRKQLRTFMDAAEKVDSLLKSGGDKASRKRVLERFLFVLCNTDADSDVQLTVL